MLCRRWWICDKVSWAMKLLKVIVHSSARPDSKQGLRHVSTCFWVKPSSQVQRLTSSHSSHFQRQLSVVAKAVISCGPADSRSGSRFPSHCWSCWREWYGSTRSSLCGVASRVFILFRKFPAHQKSFLTNRHPLICLNPLHNFTLI